MRSSWSVCVVVAIFALLNGCEQVDAEMAPSHAGKTQQALVEFPPASPENFLTQSVETVPFDGNAVIIPESAWTAAMNRVSETQWGLLQVDNSARQTAALIASIGNDGMTGGIVANASNVVENYSFGTATVLVVATNVTQFGDSILISDYFVATGGFFNVDGFQGFTTAPWAIHTFGFSITPIGSMGGARCCGPQYIGEQTGGFPQPMPGCQPGTNSLCAWNAAIFPGGSLQLSTMPSLVMFTANGTQVSSSMMAPLGGHSQFFPCANVTPICDTVGENGPYGGLGQWPGGGDGNGGGACSGGGGGSQSFESIPEMCWYATPTTMTAGSTSSSVFVRPAGGAIGPAECAGICPDCGPAGVFNLDIPPKQCWVRDLPGDICDSNPGANALSDFVAQVESWLDYQGMNSCIGGGGEVQKCGGCKPIDGDLQGLSECARCTPGPNQTQSCTYYLGWQQGQAPQCHGRCSAGIAGPVPASGSTGSAGGSSTPTLEAVSLLPTVDCRGINCGGERRQLTGTMPWGAPRPRGGAANSAADSDSPPENVNDDKQAQPREPNNFQVQNDVESTVQQQAAVAGDPVNLGTGALLLSTTDLNFPGPARPLTFERHYDSRATTRSTLGSNWHHNFSTRVVTLKKQNLPTWVDPYCMGTPDVTTCAFVVNGPSSTLFVLDPSSPSGLFMPQAGSMATLRMVEVLTVQGVLLDGGWELRWPDGALQQFDKHGYLVRDIDRFGNGFVLGYELTRAGAALEALCPEAPWGFVSTNGVYTPRTKVLTADSPGCLLLYGLTGFYDMPAFSADAHFPDLFSGQFGDVLERQKLPSGQILRYGVPQPEGQGHKRLTSVTDDLERTLSFTYYGYNEAEAGLLKRVDGPAGASVEFSYSLDDSFEGAEAHLKLGLNEAFLTRAKRIDTAGVTPGVEAAANRGYSYAYAWQHPEWAMPTDFQLAVNAYNKHFGVNYNCGLLVKTPCGDEHVFQRAPEESLVAAQLRRLYSEAADNIVLVQQLGENGASRVESETRYGRNVFHPDFDKVLAQRWGVAPTWPPTHAPPPPPGDWLTHLPVATFAYKSAAPLPGTGVDATTEFLENRAQEFITRYPLETLPVGAIDTWLGLTVPPNVQGQAIPGPDGGAIKACNVSQQPTFRSQLPGYRPSRDYFDINLPQNDDAAPGVSYAQPLTRSRLNCETLALSETYDVRHNDLAVTWVEDNGEKYFTSIAGRRKHISANANRICEWVQYTDRDGDTRLFGLNFQGRPLVNALWVDGVWKVAETLYNADGNVLSQRRVTNLDEAWSESAGDTRYSYQEAVVHAGSLGTTQPYHWAKRANVVRVEEMPRGGSVPSWVDGTWDTPGPGVSSRFAEYSYEAFFNQPRLIEHGYRANGVKVTQETDVILFDYQEFAQSEVEAQHLLLEAKTWGAPVGANASLSELWTLPELQTYFYGLSFNGTSNDSRTARGLPLVVMRKLPCQALPCVPDEVTRMTWAPSGRLASQLSPDGVLTEFKYYELDGPLSQTGAAEVAESSQFGMGQAGFLAKVTRSREWPESAGPQRPSCQHLPAQYRFLLTSCSQSPGSQLAALGLSQEAVAGILNTPAGSTTAFNYNAAGHISAVKTQAGQRVTHVTDTDGRVMRTELYAAGASTPWKYSIEVRDEYRRNVETKTFATGVQVGESARGFDNNDQIVSECTAAQSGGCSSLVPGSYVSSSFAYTKEGHLKSQTQSGGATTTYVRDARKWVVEELVSAAGEVPRFTRTQWSDDGLVQTRSFGGGEEIILTESQFYDGFRRLRHSIDVHNRVTEHRYTPQGWLAGSLLVNDTAGPTVVQHDGFGRTKQVWKNGVVLASYNRLPGGLAWAVSADGRGTRYATYDAQGQLAWAEDSLGNASVFTEVFGPVHVATSSRIRQQGVLTTGLVSTFDAMGRATQSKEAGGTLSRITTYGYDSAGNLADVLSPDGTRATAVYDWLGRVTSHSTGWTGDIETSSYTYNALGLLESTIDAANVETVQHYDGFGQPTHQTGPSSQPSAWQYDVLGRKTRRLVNGVAVLGYEYDGAKLRNIVQGAPFSGAPVLADYKYDDLGRISEAMRVNVATSPLVAAGQSQVVRTQRTYNDAQRLFTETTTVGTHAARTVTSQWSLVNDEWRRSVVLPSGRTQLHRFSTEGLETAQQRPNGRNSSFEWLDDLLKDMSSSVGLGSIAWQQLTTFDSLAQPTNLRVTAGSTLLNNGFVRDAAGRVSASSARITTPQGIETVWRGYEYSGQGRLKAVHEGDTAVALPANRPLSYMNAAVAQASVQTGADAWQYSRQVVGGLLSIQDGIHPPRFDGARGAGHKLASYSAGGGSTRQVLFDDAARMSTNGSFSYAYDDFDALAKVTHRSTATEAYLYDFEGRLVGRADRTGNGEVFVYDGVHMAESWEIGRRPILQWSAAWGPGVDNLLSLTTDTGTEYFTLNDGKSNIVGWGTGPLTQQLVARMDYTTEGRGVFRDFVAGTSCEETGDVRCPRFNGFPFGFHSAWSSPTSGLIYFRNRWYSPEAAQWLTQDPLGFVDSFDLYAFNAFDPVNFRDPFGLKSGSTSGGRQHAFDDEEIVVNIKTPTSTGGGKPPSIGGCTGAICFVPGGRLGDGLDPIPVAPPQSPSPTSPAKPPSSPNPLDPNNPRPDLCKSPACQIEAYKLNVKRNAIRETPTREGARLRALQARWTGHGYYRLNRDNLTATQEDLHKLSIQWGGAGIVTGATREDEDLQPLSESEGRERIENGVSDLVSSGIEYAGIVTGGLRSLTKQTGRAATGPKLLGPGTNIDTKIEKQMSNRGWNRTTINKIIAEPHRTKFVRDTRHLPGGVRNDDPATAYINRQGHYVIRNDRTGDIVQVSDRHDLDWGAPWD